MGLHQEEERFVTIGMDFLGRVLVVVFAWRGTRIRIISARRASRTERREYVSHDCEELEETLRRVVREELNAKAG
jgi:hypothetical protein